eukprot:76086_1
MIAVKSCRKWHMKSFIACIIGLQLLCIVFFMYYSNKCSLDLDFEPLTLVHTDQHHKQSETHQYVKLTNYRAHLNTDPDFVHFGQINEDSLSGVILKVSNTNDNTLQQLSATCDSMPQCIGFSRHPSIGVLFHSPSSFPLQYVRNWNFYIKNKAQHKAYEMDRFVNKRINYSMQLVSTSTIPSLATLGLRYAVPIIPRKFMTFEWNLGRTNNQLYSFEAMLQHSVIYLRSLILPYTTHRNHELGTMLNKSLSVWDMMKLSELVDYVFEHELATHSIPAMTQYAVTDNHDINYDKNTFDIELSSDDKHWKRYFENVPNTENLKSLQNDPNYNLLSLLGYRMFTNNPAWALSHENTIHNDWEDRWQCFVSRGLRDKAPHQALKNCRLLHFALGRYNHFKLDDHPIFDVLQFVIPSQRIRDAVDNHIHLWFEREENYRVGVHRRAMKEGGHDAAGSPYVCRYKAKSLTHSGQYSGLRRHVDTVVRKKLENQGLNDEELRTKVTAVTDMYDRTCAIEFETVQQILKFHKQEPLLQMIFWDGRIKEYKERKDRIERWFLACDNQEPEELKDLIEKYGAITLNGEVLADFWNGPLYWNMAGAMEKEQRTHGPIVEKQYIKYLKLFASREDVERERDSWVEMSKDNHKVRWWYDMSRIEFWRKEIVVFDMWMLRRSQFFVGSWHSTLTRNVCHWRGYENMYNSTNCYLVHKWRAMHEAQHKPPIDSDYPFNWFDLDAVEKPLLVWKDGK